jgi:nitroreductase
MPLDIDTAATDRLLTTTRAVRKRLDLSRPVEDEVLLECVTIAQQAPSGSNKQGWSFVMVRDQAKKTAIADIYRQEVGATFSVLREKSLQQKNEQDARVYDAAEHLAHVMDHVPVLVIPCIAGRFEDAPAPTPRAAGLYGSILPAAWSFQLALRSRGLGSAWTTAHLGRERDVGELLGIPAGVTQAALFPVAYYTGDSFSPAKRPGPETIVHWDGWTAR